LKVIFSSFQTASRMIKLLIIAALITSCGSAAASAPASSPLRIDYTNWWGDYTVLLALKLGLFDKHGVKVEPVYYEVFANALPDLAAGNLDAGLFTVNDALSVANLVDAKIVAGYDEGGVSAILASPEIKTPADLKGKKVGALVGTSGEMFVRMMLEAAGLSLSDVTLVNMAPENVPAELGKTIDAGYTWEPYITQALEAGNSTIYSSEHQAPALSPDVIVFRSDVVKRRPQDVQAFLAAWFEAVDYRLNHPEESQQIINEALGHPVEKLPGDPQIYTSKDNQQLFAENPGVDTSSLYFTTRLTIDFLKSIGALTRPLEASSILDSTLLPRP
jgi:NitT/TauT family transport system substrate-binding protein